MRKDNFGPSLEEYKILKDFGQDDVNDLLNMFRY
jgi:hypothetical protein